MEVYRQMRNKLEKFSPGLLLSQINHDFLTKFKSYLIGWGLDENTTVPKHLNTLRTYVKSAYHKGFIPVYPFNTFKIKKGNANRQYLTELEVKAIEEARLWNEGELKAQEMFLFACYTGLRFSDLITTKWEQVQSIIDEEGEVQLILSIIMEKTNLKVEIPLIEEALEILKRKDKSKEYVFEIYPTKNSMNI